MTSAEFTNWKKKGGGKPADLTNNSLIIVSAVSVAAARGVTVIVVSSSIVVVVTPNVLHHKKRMTFGRVSESSLYELQEMAMCKRIVVAVRPLARFGGFFLNCLDLYIIYYRYMPTYIHL